MELLSRNRGDELLKPGECLDIRMRLRRIAPKHDLKTVIINVFDPRTRTLPFFWSATHMAPAGARAIGSALVDSGFPKTRIVLQQWNPNIRPSKITLDGQVPDMLLVSSMQIHSAACEAMIRDACKIDPAHRPLIIAGGPKVIYEPWSVFSDDRRAPWGADVAVAGEEYVLLNLLEIVLSERSEGESMRAAFLRARNSGLLDQIPGLVYPRTDKADVVEELVHTGVQRLVGNMDELPHPSLGFRLLEPPSKSQILGARPLEASAVGRHSRIGTIVFTTGCKFSCPYCPIPAYNQRQLRGKSGARIAEELTQLHEDFGIGYFLGTDDNFFSDKVRSLDIMETLARTQIRGTPLRDHIRWATEVTVHDTLQMKEHLPLLRKAGAMTMWIGVEDMTATLVSKGQSVDKTMEALQLLRQNGVMSVPMLMHHDGQPLYTRKSNYGLLNQVRMLRKAGVIDVQVLVISPAPGSKGYEEIFRSGQAIKSAAGKEVKPYMYDGNYVIASNSDKPWRMQLNIVAVLLFLYSPLRMIRALIWPRSSQYLYEAGLQVIGMMGLVVTIPRMLAWAFRLRLRKTVPLLDPPSSPFPVRNVTASPEQVAQCK